MSDVRYAVSLLLFIAAILMVIYIHFGQRWSLPKADWLAAKLEGGERNAILMLCTVYVVFYAITLLSGVFNVY